MSADIIFLVYVYQRFKYPVDKKRVNEFGFGGADEKTAEAGAGLLEGTDGKAGEDKADAPRAGITEDTVSKTSAGVRSGKAAASSSAKEDKKSS